jgi:hypothetical protein
MHKLVPAEIQSTTQSVQFFDCYMISSLGRFASHGKHPFYSNKPEDFGIPEDLLSGYETPTNG